MKKLYIPLVIIVSSGVVFSIVASIFLLTGLDQYWSVKAARSATDRNTVYAAVLVPNERDSFLDSFLEGAKEKAAENGLDIELVRYALSGDDARENFEKLVYSRMQGLICLPPENPDLTDVINMAEGRGIPVVLIEKDIPQSRRQVFLGASPYQLGQEAARLIRLWGLSQVRAGLLVSQGSSSRQNVKSSLFIAGLNEGLSGWRGRFQVDEKISPPGKFAGEELVWSMISQDPPPNVLITTAPKDSLSALQTIVEANKVGKINLIGVGEDMELREGLKQGILRGLIVRSPRQWGHSAVETLVSLLHGETVSSYINLPVRGRTPMEEQTNAP